MEEMQFLQVVKTIFPYSRVRDRYGSPSLKEVNIFDHVHEEQLPTHRFDEQASKFDVLS